MERLLIIADDFTGALDTGVQFTERGARTRVIMNPDFDFKEANPEYQIIVSNIESRHLPAEEAYKLCYKVAKNAIDAGFEYIYKKTDSGLRGNIGAELAAVLDAAGANFLAFVPAFPKLNRSTIGGIHYVDGLPVNESFFGRDPFDPVKKSDVREIIALETDTPCYSHALGDVDYPKKQKGIHVYDATTENDFKVISEGLGKENLHLTAGCAAFAASMAHILGLEKDKPEFPEIPRRLFMACGSMNPVTLTQMDIAEKRGFDRVRLAPEMKLDPDWARSPEGDRTIKEWLAKSANNDMIIDANEVEGSTDLQVYMREKNLTIEDVRTGISKQVGRLTRILIDEGLDAVILCSGGDTFLALMNAVGKYKLTPIGEISTGCVLTSFEYSDKRQYIISKSGGFGSPDVLLKIKERLMTNK